MGELQYRLRCCRLLWRLKRNYGFRTWFEVWAYSANFDYEPDGSPEDAVYEDWEIGMQDAE
jgi:hypothetical protein